MRPRVLALALWVCAWPQAHAAMLGDAAISYSAERTVTVNGKIYTGMVFHRPGHDRHEQAVQGIPEVVILDATAKQGFLVVPGLKSYVAFAFPKVLAELDDPGLGGAPVGSEIVDGVPTVKYRVDRTVSDGVHAQGFVWISAQGVLMRLNGTVTRPSGGRPMELSMTLAKLAIGPQDPALFVVPKGLVKLPAAALEGLLGGKPG